MTVLQVRLGLLRRHLLASSTLLFIGTDVSAYEIRGIFYSNVHVSFKPYQVPLLMSSPLLLVLLFCFFFFHSFVIFCTIYLE